MEHKHTSQHSQCCSASHFQGPNVHQSLDEMDFERGIWYAALSNDFERVNSLLAKGVNVDGEDSAGFTALHYAARNGYSRICQLLIKNGADVDKTTRSGKATALHRAASQGHEDVVKLLLQHKADANWQDADGYTALHRVVINRNDNGVNLCNMLLPCTDLRLIDNNGRTVLEIAKTNGRDNLIPLLEAKKS